MAKYFFGSYLLDVDERRLVRDNEEIRMRGKLFDTLRVLVENAGTLVRKNELMQAIWPDAIVEENNLDHCISQLRKLLHPTKYIETVPRSGYRWLSGVGMRPVVPVHKSQVYELFGRGRAHLLAASMRS